MAADEQQPEHIVAIMRAVQPLGQHAFRIAQVGNLLVGGSSVVRLCFAHAVQRGIASHRISQAVGSRGGPFSGQPFQSAQAGILEGLFRPVHIAEIAQQRAHRLGPGAVNAPLIQAMSVIGSVSFDHLGGRVGPHIGNVKCDGPDLIDAGGIGGGELPRTSSAASRFSTSMT